MVGSGKVDRRHGRTLNHLCDERERGDYGVDAFLDEEDATSAVDRAEALLAAVRAWLASEFPGELP